MLLKKLSLFKQKWFIALSAILLIGVFLLAYGIFERVKASKEQAAIGEVTPKNKNIDKEKESVLNVSGLTVKDIDEIITEIKDTLGPQDQSKLLQAQLLLDMVKDDAELEQKEVSLQINYNESAKITKMFVEIPDCDKNPEDIKQLSDLATAYSDFDIQILKSPDDITKTVKVMIVPK